MVVYGALLLSLFNIVFCNEVDLPMNPIKRCVPTSTQVGNCHVCVCKTDGVFYCRDSKCEFFRNTTDPTQKECDPLHVYRYDTIFCSCDASGNWRSSACKQRFVQMQPRASPYAIQIGTNIACTPGHFYVTDCNICVCDASGYIHFHSCTNRKCLRKSKVDSCNPGDVLRTTNELCTCSDINYFIDRLCLKLDEQVIQEIKADDLDGIIDFGSHWDRLKINCNPLNTYMLDCSKCTCDRNRKLNCDDKKCEGLSRPGTERSALRINNKIIKKKPFYSLPELKSLQDKCKPGIKYRLKCNSCFCTEDTLKKMKTN